MYGEAKACNRARDYRRGAGNSSYRPFIFVVTCFAGKPAKHLIISRKLYCSKASKQAPNIN